MIIFARVQSRILHSTWSREDISVRSRFVASNSFLFPTFDLSNKQTKKKRKRAKKTNCDQSKVKRKKSAKPEIVQLNVFLSFYLAFSVLCHVHWQPRTTSTKSTKATNNTEIGTRNLCTCTLSSSSLSIRLNWCAFCWCWFKGEKRKRFVCSCLLP